MVIAISESNDEDLKSILEWSRAEDETFGDDTESFYCNRGIVERAHTNEQLLVLKKDGHAVAYLVWSPYGVDILSVKREERGKGLGAQLYKFHETKRLDEGAVLMEIECTPHKSLGFWQKQGFQRIASSNEEFWRDNRAYKKLSKSHSLKSIWPQANVVLSFYPQEAAYKNGILPTQTYTPEAYSTAPQKIKFSERIVYYVPVSKNSYDYDPVVSIELNGQELFKGKAKREAARNMGLKMHTQQCFYMDGLIL